MTADLAQPRNSSNVTRPFLSGGQGLDMRLPQGGPDTRIIILCYIDGIYICVYKMKGEWKRSINSVIV
jgi:hypothetical protein